VRISSFNSDLEYIKEFRQKKNL